MLTAPALLFAASLASSSAGDTEMVFRADVVVNSRRVLLEDLVDMRQLPAWAAAAGVVEIFRLPEHQDQLVVPTALLAQRIMTLAPGLRPLLPSRPTSGVRVRFAASRGGDSAEQKRDCIRLVSPVAAGEPLRASAFEPAPCSGPTARTFRYDVKTGLVRARRALALGEVVTSPPSGTLAGVVAGDAITVRAHVGPVIVERQATVAQSSRAGEILTLRGSDGRVFTAPAPEVRP